MKKQFQRYGEETWRDVVSRLGEKYGLERECLGKFDKDISEAKKQSGVTLLSEAYHRVATFEALYECDCLPVGEII